MLAADRLGKSYGGRVVFEELSFSLQSGTVAAVLGGNGAGKSTLLKIVAGLTAPSVGTVRWQGAGNGRLKWNCGLAAVDAPVYAELSVGENLRLFAVGRGLSLSEDEVSQSLAEWGLAGRGADYAGSLSSGQGMRLQLAVAALHQPPVLLLDEPSANLDDAGRELVGALLHEQRQRGVALLATNDPRDQLWCDAGIRLK